LLQVGMTENTLSTNAIVFSSSRMTFRKVDAAEQKLSSCKMTYNHITLICATNVNRYNFM